MYSYLVANTFITGGSRQKEYQGYIQERHMYVKKTITNVVPGCKMRNAQIENANKMHTKCQMHKCQILNAECTNAHECQMRKCTNAFGQMHNCAANAQMLNAQIQFA